MKKRTKIVVGVSIAVFSALAFLIMNGLQLMEIEDHYGDLQNVYYKSASGDIIVDNQQRVGFIKKISNRIYIEESDCMKELLNWIDYKRDVEFKVYRPEISETYTTVPIYEDIVTIIENQNLKPVISFQSN